MGDHEAVGAFYQADSCEGESDAAGWFAALRLGGGNFAFFTAAEPIAALPDVVDDLQAILDSVVFDLADQ